MEKIDRYTARKVVNMFADMIIDDGTSKEYLLARLREDASLSEQDIEDLDLKWLED